MIGIVLVSHSLQLAEAALELARQMVPGDSPRVRLAAGTTGGGIGTDATKVAAAIADVASPDGVLVLMDLGSAVLSAELALEFVGDIGGEVRLSSAPVVEGLLAAVVRAAGEGTLDEVDREARGALAAKESQLPAVPTAAAAPVPTPATASSVSSPVAASPASPGGGDVALERRFTIANPEGLHARPASLIVSTLGRLDAKVTVGVEGKNPVDARSPIGLMALGVRGGQEIVVSASGPQAEAALAALAALVDDEFGERAASA